MTAYLWRDLSPATAIKAPMEPMQLEVMAEPLVAMMCTSHIVQDDIMGVTYMDRVITSMERVDLRSSCLVAQTPGPAIEDITDLL